MHVSDNYIHVPYHAEFIQVKCDPYWPESEGDVTAFGDVVVTNVSIEHFTHYTLTVLILVKEVRSAINMPVTLLNCK